MHLHQIQPPGHHVSRKSAQALMLKKEVRAEKMVWMEMEQR
jgi:hypothetical protein